MDEASPYTITLDDDPTVPKILGKIVAVPSLHFATSAALLGRAGSYRPLAAFLDVHLGGGDCGLDAVGALRRVWPHAALFVVTSDPDSELIGRALAAGANDFLRKPFEKAELLARFRARVVEMRRRRLGDEVQVSDFVFSSVQLTIEKGGKTAHLPRLEANLLMALVESRGFVVPKDDLQARLWGSLKVSENALDKRLSGLRAALRAIGSTTRVQTHYGRGVLLLESGASGSTHSLGPSRGGEK